MRYSHPALCTSLVLDCATHIDRSGHSENPYLGDESAFFPEACSCLLNSITDVCGDEAAIYARSQPAEMLAFDACTLFLKRLRLLAESDVMPSAVSRYLLDVGSAIDGSLFRDAVEMSADNGGIKRRTSLMRDIGHIAARSDGKVGVDGHFAPKVPSGTPGVLVLRLVVFQTLNCHRAKLTTDMHGLIVNLLAALSTTSSLRHKFPSVPTVEEVLGESFAGSGIGPPQGDPNASLGTASIGWSCLLKLARAHSGWAESFHRHLSKFSGNATLTDQLPSSTRSEKDDMENMILSLCVLHRYLHCVSDDVYDTIQEEGASNIYAAVRTMTQPPSTLLAHFHSEQMAYTVRATTTDADRGILKRHHSFERHDPLFLVREEYNTRILGVEHGAPPLDAEYQQDF